MTVEVIVGCISTTLAVISSLFGGSLFSKYVAHAKELAVTQYRLTEAQKQLADVIKDVAELKQGSVVTQTKLDEFTRHIAKLELIPSLDAKLDATVDAVKTLQGIIRSLQVEHIKQHTD